MVWEGDYGRPYGGVGTGMDLDGLDLECYPDEELFIGSLARVVPSPLFLPRHLQLAERL